MSEPPGVRARAVAILLILFLLAAACGSSGDGGDADSRAAGEPDRARNGEAVAGDGDAASPSDVFDFEGDFYDVPDPLPEGEPGTLIRAEVVGVPDLTGARLLRVMYLSESVQGERIAVTGLVLHPEGEPPAEGRRVLSWAHGTTGMADRCAPSKEPTVATAAPFAEAFLERGWVVAATDYEGLGTPGRHPYIVGESEGRGTLDIVKAAIALAEVGPGNTYVGLTRTGPGIPNDEPERFEPTGRQTFFRLAAPDDLQGRAHVGLAVARGERPTDLYLRGGSVLNVFTGEIYAANVAIAADRIAYVGLREDVVGPRTRVVDVTGRILVPGYIDPHVHPANLVTPTAFARHILPLGTMDTFATYYAPADFNETANTMALLCTRSRSRASSTAEPICTRRRTRCRCAIARGCWSSWRWRDAHRRTDLRGGRERRAAEGMRLASVGRLVAAGAARRLRSA